MALVTNTISEYTAAAGVTIDGVLLKDGRVSGSQVVLRPAADSTTAIQLQNAAGTSVLNVDTTNQRVGIGTTSPNYKLKVVDPTYGGSIVVEDGETNNAIKNGRVGIESYNTTEEPFYVLYFRVDGTDNIAYFGGGTSLGNAATRLGFYTASALNTVAGTERMRISSTGGLSFGDSTYLGTNPGAGNMIIQGNVGIGTTGPTYLLSLGGNAARTVWMERHTTADTAGNALTVQAGGATAGATDKAGGNLRLYPGVSTGSAESGVQIYGCVAGASGTADRTQTLAIQVLGNKLAFFAATPVAKQTGCAVPTDLATCITAITALRTALNNYALTTVV